MHLKPPIQRKVQLKLQLMLYQNLNQQTNDAARPSFRCIHRIDPTCGERWDSDGTIDSSVAAATAAVVAAEAAEQDLIDAIAAKAASSILPGQQNWMHLKQPLIQRKAQLKL